MWALIFLTIFFNLVMQITIQNPNQSFQSSEGDPGTLFHLTLSSWFFLVRAFLHLVWIQRDTRFSPYSDRSGKIWTRKTPNTDTFHAVNTLQMKFQKQPSYTASFEWVLTVALFWVDGLMFSHKIDFVAEKRKIVESCLTLPTSPPKRTKCL